MALPTLSYNNGWTDGGDAVLSNATDVAGRISGSCLYGYASTITVTFGYAYTTAPIVIISAGNLASAQYITDYYVTSTETSFTIHSEILDDYYIFNYHVFETQSAQPTNLTIAYDGANATAASRTNATDVAGHISVTPIKDAVGTAATITYGFSYGYGMVIFCAANLAAAASIPYAYLNWGTTSFLLKVVTGINDIACSYNYHVIETQSTTASGITVASTTGGYVSGSQSIAYGTDVAGIMRIVSLNTAGSVTFNFGNSYSVAPIVVFSAQSANAAGAITKFYITTTATTFTIHVAAGAGAATHDLTYHIIETQS